LQSGFSGIEVTNQPFEHIGRENISYYIKYLISNIRCPVCHRRYTADDVLIMDHKGELWFMAVACPECETRGLVFAIVADRRAQPEPITDLSPEELALLDERGPITADDVLDLHDLLRDYRGDMAELLGNEP